MPSSRSGTRSRWTSTPAPPRAISASDGREPGGAAVLERLDEPALDELERGLDQLLAGERVADLHRRALLVGALAELLAREHATRRRSRRGRWSRRRGRAALPVASRRARVTRSDGQQPDAHRVDEAVARVRLVEDRLAADRRDADAVPVVADPGDRAPEAASPGRRSGGRRAARPAARPSRRCRAGSRRRPVAAPWNGSTADGWLWLSTLNATASPSPRSITPAFSPGPWSTRSPGVGSRFRSSAECL